MIKINHKTAALFALLIFIFISGGCTKKDEPKKIGLLEKKEVNIDLNRSSIVWTIYKNNLKHTGTIKFLNGRFNLESGIPVSGTCDVDLNSIKIEDIKDSTENSRVLNFLKSKNFLNVEKFPRASVNIRSIVPLKYQNMPNVNTTIKGNITIQDSIRAMVVTALTTYYQDSIVSRSNFSLNGAQWNLPLKAINIDKDSKENPYKEDYDIELFIVAK